MEEMIGGIAATLTTISFIPQAYSVLRTRNTAGISLGMYLLFTFGVFMWIVYGILINRWPIIIANVVTEMLAMIILYITWSNLRRKR